MKRWKTCGPGWPARSSLPCCRNGATWATWKARSTRNWSNTCISSPRAHTSWKSVRVDDSELVELYESRVRANDEATARIPLSRSRYYAAGVAHSASGALRGLDNHGKSVLGFASPVRGTPWIIIAKVNLAEATAQL